MTTESSLIRQKTFELTQKGEAASPDAVGSWVISSSSYDRVNDRIMPSAIKAQAGKDILCLWQHSADQPVGRWANVRTKGDKLVADLVLAKTNLGMMIRALLDVKTPLGASIGFRGKGKQNEKGGIDFSEISILETSIVSVPCNADAMQIAKSFGLSSVIEATPDMAVSGTSDETLTRARAAILAANRTLRI